MPNKLTKPSGGPREGALRESIRDSDPSLLSERGRSSAHTESSSSSRQQVTGMNIEGHETWNGQQDCDRRDQPCDSQGVDLHTSDKVSNRLDWEKAGEIPLLDADGTSRPFKSLYSGDTAIGDQQMIIFVRHFLCGACQAYLKTLSNVINLKTYFTLPVPTSIVVIGLGSPALIPEYRKLTGISFQIFTDPTRRLHKFLGLSWAVTIGAESKYYGMSDIRWAIDMTKKLISQKKNMPKEDKSKGGAWWWVGGEFLIRNGKLVWCHRMKNFRDHVDIDTMKKLLLVEDNNREE